MTSLGVPAKLGGDSLPTGSQIYNHFLHLIKDKCSKGEWRYNTPFSDKVSCVMHDVTEVWDKTSIPHVLHTREGERRITSLLSKCKTLTKVPLDRRDADFGAGLDQLFDAAVCQHANSECSCDLPNKVGLKITYNLEYAMLQDINFSKLFKNQL